MAAPAPVPAPAASGAGGPPPAAVAATGDEMAAGTGAGTDADAAVAALRQAGGVLLVNGQFKGMLADAATLVDTEAKQATVAEAVDGFLERRRVTATEDIVTQLRSVHGSIPLWFVRDMHSVLQRFQAWWANGNPEEEDPVLARWLDTLAAAAWPPKFFDSDHALVPGAAPQEAHAAAHAACVAIAQQWHAVCSAQNWYGTVGRSHWEAVVAYMDATPDDYVATLLAAVEVRVKYGEMDVEGRANLWSVVPDTLVEAIVHVLHGVQEGGELRLGTMFEWLSEIKRRVPSSKIATMLKNLADTTRDMGGAEYFMRMLKLAPEALSMGARTQFEGLLSHVLSMLTRVTERDVDQVAAFLDNPTQRAALESQMEGSLTEQAASLGGSRNIVSLLARAMQDPEAAVGDVIDSFAPRQPTSRHTADLL